jgi:hypothetical protein
LQCFVVHLSHFVPVLFEQGFNNFLLLFGRKFWFVRFVYNVRAFGSFLRLVCILKILLLWQVNDSGHSLISRSVESLFLGLFLFGFNFGSRLSLVDALHIASDLGLHASVQFLRTRPRDLVNCRFFLDILSSDG